MPESPNASLTMDIFPTVGPSATEVVRPREPTIHNDNAVNNSDFMSLSPQSFSPALTDEEVDFVENPDEKYNCVRCGKVLRPPVLQTACGHRMCSTCVDSLFLETHTVECPGQDGECEPLTKETIYKDIATAKELLRMRVYCPYRSNGCTHIPTWGSLRKHEQNCEYAMISCNNLGCDVTVPRAELLRHEQQCEYFLVKCEKCEEDIARKDLPGHSNTCKPKPKPCVFEVLGCPYEGTHEELSQHNVDSRNEHELHLVNATSKISKDSAEMQNQISELKSQTGELQVKIDDIETNFSKIFLKEILERITQIQNEAESMKQRVMEKADEQEVAEHASTLRTVQNTTKTHENRITKLEQNRGGAMSEQAMEKISHMESTLSNYDYRMAENDIRFRLLETASYNGHMIWKITNYARRKKDAIDGRTLSLYSQPFYTSYYGYKMCARVYLNGDGMGRGTHLSLFFVVMRGEYDALLQWPFRLKVTLSLLDQTGNNKHVKDTFRPDPTSTSFKRPVTEMNIASGSPMFAAQSAVESDTYLRDDTLFIRVSVDCSELPEVFP